MSSWRLAPSLHMHHPPSGAGADRPASGEKRDGRRPRGRTCIRVWAYTGASAGVVTPFVRKEQSPSPGLSPTLLLLPRRGSGHGSLESIAYRAHSARTAEPVHLAANA
jgi:hypothetical protein